MNSHRISIQQHNDARGGACAPPQIRSSPAFKEPRAHGLRTRGISRCDSRHATHRAS
jgi:hypothetical protein